MRRRIRVMAIQINSRWTVCSTVCSIRRRRKHQISALLCKDSTGDQWVIPLRNIPWIAKRAHMIPLFFFQFPQHAAVSCCWPTAGLAQSGSLWRFCPYWQTHRTPRTPLRSSVLPSPDLDSPRHQRREVNQPHTSHDQGLFHSQFMGS